jgi:phospholipid transport system substrate-binding protein
MKKIKGIILLSLLVLLTSTNSFVLAAELNAPQKAILETSDLLHNIISKEKEQLGDRQFVFQLVNEVVEPRVDLNKISKLILGKHWRKATDEQKAQFQKEFKNLLVNTYATAFTEFNDWTVKFLPMSLAPTDKRVVVKSEIITASRPAIAVNYRMAKNKTGEWKAYDVIIEGISMVTNYKGSFSSSIKRSGGLDNVIKDLAAKNKLSEESSKTQDVEELSDNT